MTLAVITVVLGTLGKAAQFAWWFAGEAESWHSDRQKFFQFANRLAVSFAVLLVIGAIAFFAATPVIGPQFDSLRSQHYTLCVAGRDAEAADFRGRFSIMYPTPEACREHAT